jgi:hypothetical protein
VLSPIWIGAIIAIVVILLLLLVVYFKKWSVKSKNIIWQVYQIMLE